MKRKKNGIKNRKRPAAGIPDNGRGAMILNGTDGASEETIP